MYAAATIALPKSRDATTGERWTPASLRIKAGKPTAKAIQTERVALKNLILLRLSYYSLGLGLVLCWDRYSDLAQAVHGQTESGSETFVVKDNRDLSGPERTSHNLSMGLARDPQHYNPTFWDQGQIITQSSALGV